MHIKLFLICTKHYIVVEGRSSRQIQFLETALDKKEFSMKPVQSVSNLENELLGFELASATGNVLRFKNLLLTYHYYFTEYLFIY